MNSENIARKQPRQRVLKDGKLFSDDMATMVDVKVRDLTEKGARIEIAGIIRLPARLSLLIVSKTTIYPAVARWQRGNQIGIEFVGEGRPAGFRVTKASVH